MKSHFRGVSRSHDNLIPKGTQKEERRNPAKDTMKQISHTVALIVQIADELQRNTGGFHPHEYALLLCPKMHQMAQITKFR